MVVFVLHSVNVVYYIDWFSCIELFLHFRKKKNSWSWCKSFWCTVEFSLLVILDDLLVIWSVVFFSSIFVWIYSHWDKYLTLSFEFGSVLFFIFWKSLRKFKFCNSFSIFAYLFKNPALSFIDVFLFYISLISGLIFIISFLSLFWV